MKYCVFPMLCALVCLAMPASAGTYYVDFDRGNDANNGRSPDAAFKRCPGDPQTIGVADAVELEAGDVMIFKGGVAYRGTVNVKASGAEDARITFDGNSAGTFGTGKALIDGGTFVTGWKRCVSAEQAKGNPRWKEIFCADVPKPYSWRTFNLCDREKPLPVAQDPNPSDPFFQENIHEYYQVDKIVIDDCFVHHCPGHTKGILLRYCSDAVTRDCKLVKNTSTALDYYGCTDGLVQGTLVSDHYGMHANGLTFYLGCKNIVVEGNEVYNSNIGLTIQAAEDVTVRNNIIDSGGKSLCVGIWPATPLRNVRFLNNLFLRASTQQTWHAAIFSNSRGPEGLVVKNNVIDGLSGNLPGQYSHNIYTRWGPNQEDHKLGLGEIYEPDLKNIFVAPENRDFRLNPGGPAVDAGVAVQGNRDFDGKPRPQGKAVDIGPYEYDEK